MPIYEYKCNQCGEHFDIEQRMTDDPLTTHDNCGGVLSKVFSSAGIVLKGSGFYKTDARSSNNTKEKSKESTSSPAKPANPKSETKSDKTPSKPAKATDSKTK